MSFTTIVVAVSDHECKLHPCIFSVGQICRFCRKLRGRRPCSPVPSSVCDTAARQTSPKIPLAPCTRRHRASGNCKCMQTYFKCGSQPLIFTEAQTVFLPVNVSDKLLQLTSRCLGFKVFDFGLSVRSDIHIQLRLLTLGVHHPSARWQQEGTQPQRVDLKAAGQESARVHTLR